MRQRSTWKQTPRSASTQRRADDLYTMNRDGGNPQPAVNEYENGDPSSWAEDVNTGSSVEKEYAGGAVKRNEIGFAEFRDDTWSHAGTRPWGKGGQYDNAKLAAVQRKAVACERVARAILRTNDEKLIEETALDLMNLPSKALVSTMKRMDKTSPAALSENGRFRRALACTKLAALILSEEAKEVAIERLATLFNGLDDPTLKGILSVVATSRVADDKPEEGETKEHEKGESKEFEKGEKEEKKEEKKEVTSAEKKEDGEKEEKEEEEEGVLTDADFEKLEAIVKDAVVEAGTGGEAADEEKGVEDLQQLFEGGDGEEGQAPPPPAPGAPPVDITFDEGEEDAIGRPAMAADLNGLFDTEESIAQREFHAAQAGNFNQRTASTKGAKKLGQVRAQKSASVDESLESLWERPGH